MIWASRNAEALRRLVPRLALVLVLAPLAQPARGATIPPPDATWTTRISGVTFLCARWGAAPHKFIIACVPKKRTAPGAA